MYSLLEVLPLLLPALYLGASVWFRTIERKPEGNTAEISAKQRRYFLRGTKAFAVAPVAVASLIFIAQIIAGPIENQLFTLTYLSVSAKVDTLGSLMALLISIVGAVCLLFSRRYLAGEERQPEFLKNMALTLASVSALVLSNSLFVTLCAWIAMSLTLHRLLLFYPERTGAQRAASKKYVAARIGDLCLLAASALLVLEFGTDRIDTILTAAGAAADISIITNTAAMFIVVAAVMKTAQFPLNGWLVEVMETPTPVSALLHAGVVNAGGFLVIRFADLLALSPESMTLLAGIGGVTAVVGSIAMISQTSIKVGLAWSTVAQMGMMILQCGLGAFSIAALHLLAHSLYKAHAFLTAGSVIDQSRMPVTLAPKEKWRTPFYSGVFMVSSVIVGLVVTALGTDLLSTAGGALFAGLLLLGIMHLVHAFLMLDEVNGRAVAGLGMTLLTVCGAYGAAHLLATTGFGITDYASTPAMYVWTALVLTALLSILVIQWVDATCPRPTWLRHLLVHAANGFYASTLVDRMLENRRTTSITATEKRS